MGFIDKIKEYRKYIKQVENNIYSEKQDYLEIYERNVQLEREIETRTKELNLANQRMLTLKHIWEMMNSSKPLSSVLESIVNSLQGELGYLHSCILQKKEDEKGEYLNIITYSQDKLVDRFDEIIKSQVHTKRLNYDPKSIYGQTLVTGKITESRALREDVTAIMPDITESDLEKLLNGAYTRSIIVVPLNTLKKNFGWLVVFSSRDTAAEGEINFLNLFAKQIELAVTIADLFQATREQAVTDGLTGLYNRRFFEEALNKEVIRAGRQNQPFSLIGLDLDYLKQINDKYGHSYGDLAIKTVADVLKKNARAIDIPARMGGEEFNILLPGIDAKGAMIAAERIRKAIEDSKLETIGTVTASIGVATFLEHSNSVEELTELTDQAMYTSKRKGRNRVSLAKPISEVPWQEIAIETFVDILSKNRVPVDKDTAKELCQKLQNEDVHNATPTEMLYSVADMLAQTYNPLHNQGSAKSKVFLAATLAKRFDLSKQEVDKLKIAMLLYDIGNIMLPQDLLQKATPLTEEERAHIHEHPIIAARDILKPISNIQDVIPIIEHHHESWDGSGYPSKISGENIPLTSQIVLITDAYFALIEPRAYRSELSPKEALEVIKKDAGKKWNKLLVNEFIALVENELG